MIDIRKLKELVRLMVENDLAELDLRDQQETVTIKRGADNQPVVVAPAQIATPAAAPAQAAPDSDAAGSASNDAGLVAIESPMVGTFYASANPESDPFVSVGKSISADSVVCMVEAMKVFNEIKAECTGSIERVMVSNGDAVEFGQQLFLVKPA